MGSEQAINLAITHSDREGSTTNAYKDLHSLRAKDLSEWQRKPGCPLQIPPPMTNQSPSDRTG